MRHVDIFVCSQCENAEGYLGGTSVIAQTKKLDIKMSKDQFCSIALESGFSFKSFFFFLKGQLFIMSLSTVFNYLSEPTLQGHDDLCVYCDVVCCYMTLTTSADLP